MSTTWQALRESLDRSIRTLKADGSFQKAKAEQPALRRFPDPGSVVYSLSSPDGDLDEKDRVLAALVLVSRDIDRGQVGVALLWLGLWPGLEGVLRRCIRHFPGDGDGLVSEIGHAFTSLIKKLDLTRVERVAATLVWNTERWVLAERKRVWAERKRAMAERAAERDQWRANRSNRHVLDGTAAQPDFNDSLRELCAWVRPIAGHDTEMLVAILVLDEGQKEVGLRLGLRFETMRKRYQRAFARFRDRVSQFEDFDRVSPGAGLPSPRGDGRCREPTPTRGQEPRSIRAASYECRGSSAAGRSSRSSLQERPFRSRKQVRPRREPSSTPCTDTSPGPLTKGDAHHA